MPFNIAMIPYTNMDPYRALGCPNEASFVPMVPKKSIEELKKGTVIAGIVPVGGLPSLKDIVEPVGSFGIAAKKESKSVLFFSSLPFEQIKSDDSIIITKESASSVRLLRLMFYLKSRLKTLPFTAKEKDRAKGELIIGDSALKTADSIKKGNVPKSESKYSYITDLCTLWYGLFNLPFVFARWVIRRDAPLQYKNILEDWLQDFKEQEQKLVEKSVPESAKRLGLSQKELFDYCKVIRRVLNEEDIAGQNLFLKLAYEYKLIP